jgi:enterochelin esterase family protein
MNQYILASKYLKREVRFDTIYHNRSKEAVPVLLMTDGQDAQNLRIEETLQIFRENEGHNFLFVGIHSNENRIQEYGIKNQPDYAGRGSLAGDFQKFIVKELLPFISGKYTILNSGHSVTGFSLGGLTAFDLAIEHPDIFSKAGVFSGSFWWRSQPLRNGYSDEKHRIIHQKVRNMNISTDQKFWFQCGTEDEISDRNGNGVIDSIDDTLDLISELEQKIRKDQIKYMEIENGKHNIETWAAVFPDFLSWIIKN